MASIDERVVKMTFDNARFESKVKTTMSTLDKLKTALSFNNTTKGMEKLNESAKKFDLSALTDGLEAVRVKFSALQVVGVTVLSNLTTAAMNYAAKINSYLTNAIVQGGITRALNIEQAKFQLEGLGVAWERISEDINYAVEGTAYGLDVAAKAASQLTASGVEVGNSMKTALRGISGVAAMTNSTYEDISEVFTTVAGNGRLFASELNRLGARGINAAATLGQYLGKTEQEVRDMTSKGQIDFATFAAAMDSAFGEHAKDANKTFTGAMANMRAALSRIGADVASVGLINLRDLFNSLRVVINNVHKSLKPFIENLNDIQTKVTKTLVSFIDMGSLESILNGIGNSLSFVARVLTPIKDAFLNIFPPVTLDQLSGMAKRLEELTANFKISDETAKNLSNTFSGFFSILSLLWETTKKVADILLTLLNRLSPVGAQLLRITGTLGVYISGVIKATEESKGLSEVFEKIKSIFEPVANVLNKITGALADLLIHMDPKPPKELQEAFAPLYNIFLAAAGALDKLTQAIFGIQPLMGEFAEQANNAFGTVRDSIINIFSSGNAQSGVNLLNSGLLAAILATIINLVQNIDELVSSIKQPISVIEDIKGVLEELQEVFVAYQNTLKSEALKNLAVALAIFAASILLLSFINPDRLISATGALTIALGELVAAMKLMDIILSGSSGYKGFIRLSTMMITLSVAIVILSSAFAILSTMDMQQILQGIVGIAGAMGVLIGALYALSKIQGKMTATAFSLIAVASALNIMAEAVSKFGTMDVATLKTGLGAITAALVILAAFVKVTSGAKSMISVGLGLNLVASSLNILVGAIEKMGNLSLEQIGKGLLTMAGALVLIAVAVRMMPRDIFIIGPGLLAVSVALEVISDVVKKMGSLTWDEIAHGLVALGGSLIIIAAALRLMSSTLTGSAALVVAAGALAVLTPILKVLGNMSLIEIGTALIALAGAFTVLGLAGMLLSGVVTTLLALGGAVTLLGVGLLAAGAGLVLFSTGLTTLAGSATAIAVGLSAIFQAIIGLIPALFKGLAEGFIAFVTGIADSAAALVEAAKTIIVAVCQAIQEAAPAIIDTIAVIIDKILDKIVELTPKFIETFKYVLVTAMESLSDFTPALLKLGVVAYILQRLNPVQMLIGLAAFAEFIVGLGALMVAIGALMEYVPDIKTFIDNGVPVMNSLGEAIGSFIGGLVSTILDSLADTIPRLGACLSQFMTNIEPFLKGIQGISEDHLNGMKRIVEIVALLAAADFINGMNIFGGGIESQFKALSNSLPDFGKAMAAFSNEVKGINPAAVMAAAMAGQMLAKLWGSLPKEGGVFQFFGGQTVSFDDFGDQLVSFGNALVRFSKVVGKKGAINSKAIKDVIEASKGLVELVQNLPEMGGFAQAFAGEKNLALFGDQIVRYVEQIKKANESVSDIGDLKTEKFVEISKIGTALSELASSLQNSGGALQWWAGAKDLGNFGQQVATFMREMKTANDSVNEMVSDNSSFNSEVWSSIVDTATALSDLASTLQNSGGALQWWAGAKDLGNFGQQVATFMRELKKANDSVNEMGGTEGNPFRQDVWEAVISISNELSLLAETLQNSGGVIQWWAGAKDLGNFGQQVATFMRELKKANDSVNEMTSENNSFNSDVWDSIIKIIRSLTRVQGALQNSGGALQWWAGAKDLGNFGQQVATFMRELKKGNDAVNEMTSFDSEKWNASVEAGRSLAELQKVLSPSGGVIQWFVGLPDLGSFGDQISAFGAGISGFSDAITSGNGLNLEAISNAVSAGRSLAELVGVLGENGGTTGSIFSLFSGTQYSMTKFSGEIVAFGEAISGFSEEVSGINSSKINIAMNFAYSLTELADKVREVGDVNDRIQDLVDTIATMSSNIGGMADNLTNLGSAIINFYNTIRPIDTSVVQNVITATNRVVNFGNTISGLINTEIVKDFADALKSMAVDGVNSFISSMGAQGTPGTEAVKSFFEKVKSELRTQTDSLKTSFNNSAVSLITSFKNAVINNSDRAKDAVRSMVNGCVNTIKLMESSFVILGENSAIGYANGINKLAHVAVNNARNMARNSMNAVKRETGQRSPSKKYRKIGMYDVLGYALGYVKYGHIAAEAAADMASDTMDAVSKAVDLASTAASEDINYSPVITPVIDLDGAKKEVSYLNSMYKSVGQMSVKASRYIPINGQYDIPDTSRIEEPAQNNVSIVQNNYSPKALSTFDIYRNTKKLVRTVEGRLK